MCHVYVVTVGQSVIQSASRTVQPASQSVRQSVSQSVSQSHFLIYPSLLIYVNFSMCTQACLYHLLCSDFIILLYCDVFINLLTKLFSYVMCVCLALQCDVPALVWRVNVTHLTYFYYHWLYCYTVHFYLFVFLYNKLIILLHVSRVCCDMTVGQWVRSVCQSIS